MAELPYTQVTGKLKTLFEKIQQVGKPNLVDKKWLASINFKGSNDSTLIHVLKFIDFVDSSGKPTDRWGAYRDRSRAGQVLADAIIYGYSELFSVYRDAYLRTDDELKAFITSKTVGGSQVISKTLTTMRTLFGLASFESASVGPLQKGLPETLNDHMDGKPDRVSMKGVETGYVININIQLTLPESKDGDVYDKLFTSMKKHLLS